MRFNKGRRAILFVLAIALVIGLAQSAQACSCAYGGTPVCQDYWSSSAVFVGTVIDSKLVPVKTGEYEHQQRSVRLSLDEIFRGVEGAEVEVMTGLGGGDCGFGFRQAGRYLVYAHAADGKLWTGLCSRTKDLSSAAADLTYIRGLKGKSAGSIYGEVGSIQRDANDGEPTKPIANATVLIEGTTSKEVLTDAKGEYRVEGLAPGDYTVQIILPKGFSARETKEKVSLSPGGCAVVCFDLENDGQINGRVLNPQGLPVNKAEIVLHEFNKERYRGYVDYAYSDEEGKYEFKRIPAGRYVLAIRFDGLTGQNSPFPVIYYPGVGERSQAKTITIGKGQTLADYNLEMPPLPLEFEISGSVVWANGKPATGARVGYLVSNDSVVYSAKNNGASTFKFKAYEGLKLSISAALESENGKSVYSDTVEITVAPGAPEVRLVLPQP